ncbi:hypothetical protein LV779_07710 [Streptomyces thinghirensis]|nr:hypothetical protein [Streptomyces thinghirensis]
MLPIAWTVAAGLPEGQARRHPGHGPVRQLVPGQLRAGLRLGRLLVQPVDHPALHGGLHRSVPSSSAWSPRSPLRKPFEGRGVLRAAMLLPYVAPVVAAAFVWEVALSPQYGVVNDWGGGCSAGTTRSRSCRPASTR